MGGLPGHGRIKEVLQSHRFESGEELEATLNGYVWLYNQQFRSQLWAVKRPCRR